MEAVLAARIQQQRLKHCYRQRHPLSARQGVMVTQQQTTRWVFCNNDYLGMAQHPVVIKALQQAVERYGVGGIASQLVTGHTEAHHDFELAFAEFVGREAALLYSCGYMANIGLLSVLVEAHDQVVADKFIHASLLDAVRMTGAKLQRYPHCNYAQLEKYLAQSTHTNRWLLTDSVFSMQGDLADLPHCAQLAKQYQATLIVDDAHAIGVLGERGAGSSEHFALTADALPVMVYPLGKAFGVMGAMVAGSQLLIDALVQFSRPYIYTNALPAAFAAAGIASLSVLQREHWRREKLQHLIRHFRATATALALPLADATTAIQPLIIGSSKLAQQLSEQLLQHGYLLSCMRPPTVAESATCLRITLSCLHEEQHITQLLQTIKKLYDNLSLSHR